MNECLTTCRGCCKFKKDEIYFAPKITREEIATIKSNGSYKDVFRPFKKSKKIFQITLIKSGLTKEVFVCPYLNEATQACEIYNFRPFDCEFWPFLLMYDKKKEKILIAHVNKEICPITDTMNEGEFKNYLIKKLDKLMREKDVINLINKYPELIWDYEPDTFVIKEIV